MRRGSDGLGALGQVRWWCLGVLFGHKRAGGIRTEVAPRERFGFDGRF